MEEISLPLAVYTLSLNNNVVKLLRSIGNGLDQKNLRNEALNNFDVNIP